MHGIEVSEVSPWLLVGTNQGRMSKEKISLGAALASQILRLDIVSTSCFYAAGDEQTEPPGVPAAHNRT